MRVAVAIPLRNEEASVDRLLETLLAQTRPPDEIVIADAGSTDRTLERVRAFPGNGVPIRAVSIGPAFPGRGRNEEIKATECEWIAFTDGGVRVDRRWLERLTAPVEADPSLDVVLGNFEPVADTFFRRCAALAYVPERRAHDGAGTWRGRFVASSLVRRALWQRVGGFPEHLRSAEDLLFLEAAERASGRVAIAPDATVYWEVQPDLARTVRRFTTYSRYNILAGKYDSWQRAIVRRYAALLAASLPLGPLAPVGFAALGATLWTTRAARSMRAKPEFVERTLPGRLLQLVTTAGVVASLDYAAFRGIIDWWRLDRGAPRRG